MPPVIPPAAAAGGAGKAAAIQGGTQLAGTALNALFNHFTNRQSQKWSERFYDRQYRDNIAFWRMQNEYNDPSARMARLKAAGINPAILYGGSAGNVGGQASPIKTPDIQGAQFRAPDLSSLASLGRNAIDTYFDTEIKQAQLDNFRAQNTVLLEEANLKAVQARSTGVTADRGLFDLGLEQDLRQTSADYRRENLRRLKQSIGIDLRRDERESLRLDNTLLESAERIATMRLERTHTKRKMAQLKQNIENLKKDARLKQLSINLYKDGLTPNDPLYLRMLSQFLTKHGINPFQKEDLFKEFKN